MRQIEKIWVRHLMNAFTMRARLKESIKNTRIIALFSQIARTEGSYDYCFGSRIIISQVKQWLKSDGEGIESSDSDDKSGESKDESMQREINVEDKSVSDDNSPVRRKHTVGIPLDDNSDEEEIKEEDGEEIEDSKDQNKQRSKKIKLEGTRKK